MDLETPSHRAQRPHHLSMPAADPVQRRPEACVGEAFGAHRTEVGREQHDVHVDVEAVLQRQTRTGHTVGGVDPQREVAQGVRHAPTSP
jgi:hypothetical protein